MYKTFVVNEKDSLVMRTGTDGFQPKFTVNDYFLKTQCQMLNVLRDDWAVEYIASLICKHFMIYAVEQKPCHIIIQNRNKPDKVRMGVVSRNFELDNLHFISAERLFNTNNQSISTKEYRSFDAVNKIFYLANYISIYSNIPYYQVMEYLFSMVFVDLLVLNQDRHIHNFGVCWDNIKNCYTISPLFDFGMGLFENSNDFDDCNSLDDCLRYSYLEPFGEDPFDLANMLLNYQPFNKYLSLKKKYGKLSINKNIFPNDLAYEYYKKMKCLLQV